LTRLRIVSIKLPLLVTVLLFSEAMHIASSRAARRKQKLMLIDGPRLILKALSCGVELKAIYCTRPRDIDAELSTGIRGSAAKLYQLTPQQMRLCKKKGITSAVFGNCCLLYATNSPSVL